MIYTAHALQRMEERNFSKNMIEKNIDLFFALGKWNCRGDRITLDANNENVRRVIKERASMLQTILCNIKDTSVITTKTVKHFVNLSLKGSLSLFSYKKNVLKRMLKDLKKLEHKGEVTLVIQDDVMISIYHKTKRDLSKTQKRWVKDDYLEE